MASAGISTYSNVAIVVLNMLIDDDDDETVLYIESHDVHALPCVPSSLHSCPSLNALLVALALPFALDHPTDLTPSLLLAIFESLIGARLPIPSSVRQSRTRDAKSRAMLVLLGVLECDVLRGALCGAGGVSVDGWVDEIGLGEVDPERLADGGWEETIFVGELLCWLARRKGILPHTRSSRRSSHARSLYSNHHSYGTEEGEGHTADFSTSLLLQPSPTQNSWSPRPPSPSPSIDDQDADADFSALSHITDVPRHPLVHSPEPSLSAVSNANDEFEEASQDTLQIYDPRQMMQDAEEEDDRPPTFRPRCIHDLEDPSYIRALAGPSSSLDPDEGDDAYEQDNDDPYAPPTPTPRRIRLTGWIDTVDAATELSHFSASRPRPGLGPPSQLQSHKHTRTREFSRPTLRPTTEVSPHQYLSSGKSRPPSPPARVPTSPPPSPPSPTTHSDPPFDISFSSLNNTSTPAKPRPPRRFHHETEAEPRVGVDRNKSGGSAGTGTGIGRPPLRRRDRSPSYTPSPPSFSTPGSLRSGGTGSNASGLNTGTGAKARLCTTPAPLSTTTRTKGYMSPPLPSSSTKGKPPPPAGSTATTSMLLTERARLLTELSALKRVRAAIGVGVTGAV
ncbi:hypothetical protein J3R83DRAFT_5703 [Lanmaoa asiatica]|nr:hypothetical protein J3R83DRAFT_5703 [Lanmaoa asiatica]